MSKLPDFNSMTDNWYFLPIFGHYNTFITRICNCIVPCKSDQIGSICIDHNIQACIHVWSVVGNSLQSVGALSNDLPQISFLGSTPAGRSLRFWLARLTDSRYSRFTCCCFSASHVGEMTSYGLCFRANMSNMASLTLSPVMSSHSTTGGYRPSFLKTWEAPSQTS